MFHAVTLQAETALPNASDESTRPPPSPAIIQPMTRYRRLKRSRVAGSCLSWLLDQVGVDEDDSPDDRRRSSRPPPNVPPPQTVSGKQKYATTKPARTDPGDHSQSVAAIAGVGAGFLVDHVDERDDRPRHRQRDDHRADVVRDRVRLFIRRRQHLATAGVPRGVCSGTNATKNTSVPAKFSSTSSVSLLPL